MIARILSGILDCLAMVLFLVISAGLTLVLGS
jgi:hypothetical protein